MDWWITLGDNWEQMLWKNIISIFEYDAAVQLERTVAALGYVANECDEDLDKYCGSVAVGEGRLIDCLKKHDKKVSGRCNQARKDVGVK